jgi:hypothetical protein
MQFDEAVATVKALPEGKRKRLCAEWAADEAKAKLRRARALIGARKASAIALADALRSIEALISQFEQRNADLAKLELTPEQRVALAAELMKLPRDVRATFESGLPDQARQVDAGRFRAQIEAVHEVLLKHIGG